MHLLIPFASAISERGTQTLRQLKLPQLGKLLARLAPATRFGGDEYSLTPPHERVLADALGWHGADGCLPWAAYLAARDGVQVGKLAWGQLTPIHLRLGADHVSLPDPKLLCLSAQDSMALFEAARPLFESEGFTLAWGAPERWYAAHESLAALPSAAIERVIGRKVELWLPQSPQSGLIRRLQNEVQMLFYQQAVNDHRVGLGTLPINSFWLSGCGRAQPEHSASDLVIDDSLRAAALSSDWDTWAEAWRALDAGAVHQALARVQGGETVRLTLCGERFAQSYDTRPQGLWSRLGQAFSPLPIAPLLELL